MNGMFLPTGRARALVVVFTFTLAVPAFAAEPSLEAAPEPDAVASAAVGAAPTASVEPASTPSTSTATASPPSPDEIVIVGRRLRTEAQRDRTASATVISAERFAGEAKGVAELVATAPGVAVNDYGGLGRLATASIRGSTADGVLVLLDGIPLNTSFGGGVDLSSIPRAWIDRIEVVRGVEGAHYGAGALGGVVNVITRRPAPGAWSAELTGGSFGTGSAAADRSLGLGDATLMLAGGVDGTEGAFPYEFSPQRSLAGSALEDRTRAHNGSVRGGGLAKLVVPLGAVRLDAVAELSGGRRELPPDVGHDSDGSRDWQQDARALAALRAVVPGPLSGLSLAGRGGLRLDQTETRLAALGGTARQQRGGLASSGAEALLDHGIGILRVEGGAESEWIDADAAGGTHSRPRLSAAASEEVRVASGRIRVAGAGRIDRVGRFEGTSGKLGVTAAVWGPVSIRASAGQTFRAPSFAELYLQQGVAQPNPELQAEKGTGGDAAVVVDGPLGIASLGGHATLYRDLIVWEPASFGRLKPFNTGKAFLGGVEAEAASPPIRRLAGLSLSGAYTWLRSENLRGPEEVAGKDLPRRPRHRLYARASIAPGPVTLHLEAHYVGAQWQDARNVLPVSSSVLWNTGGSVALNRARSVTLHLEVRNALDDRTLEDPLANPLPGRMVLLSVRAGSGRAEVTP
ncbi:MAG TPA: TonB-dependent receptor [Anaeromyxobacter sp.]